MSNTLFIPDGKEIEKLLTADLTAAKSYDALQREQISIEDFAAILRHDPRDMAFTEKLAARARELTLMRFGKVKGFYIPLYLSSACHNSCAYCGFSSDNRVKRTTLSVEDAAKELRAIYGRGYRNILLVSGEQKDFKNREYMASCVAAAREAGFHAISVEFGALDGESAGMMARAGAQCFVLYQETYHRETYERVHTGGLKRDYVNRLHGVERAIDAGFRQVALGFLAGLAEPVYEALALYSHLARLKERFWETEFSVSFPRLNHAYGMNGGFERVSDRRYATILMAFRVAFPELSINLSTRESPAFRDGMANICATHLSVESKTSPGGYAIEGEERLEQFAIHDGRNLAEMGAAMKRLGYDVHFKDWEMELNRL